MFSIHQRLFDHIALPEGFQDRLELIAQRGPIVYVLRNRSATDLLALHAVIRKAHLPALGFTHDLQLGLLDPVHRQLLPRRRGKASLASELSRALLRRESALLFLKRAPLLRDVVGGKSGSRGLKEGDDLLVQLFDLQARLEQPIQLVPLVFLWTHRPDTQGAARVDLFIGPREWPSHLRSAFQVLSNYRNAELRMGEPVELSHYITEQGSLPQETRIRRLVYVLLRRLERERRSATGPASLPPDLLRQRVLRNPHLQDVIRRMAGDDPKNRLALTRKADEALREMQALPNVAALRASRMLADQLFQRLYASVDVDIEGLRRIRECAKEGTLVLLPSHKSHMDSLVVSYVFDSHHLGLPLIAAGDNLSFFPVGPIARRSGAFFIRRSFKGDRLYAAIVEAYLRRLLRDGHTLELFLEGGRSRSGKLLKPQIGLLSILVSAALSMPNRTVYFLPISIGYERLIEAQSFQNENLGQDKEEEDAAALLRSTELLSGRYGRIDVQFGQALTLGELREQLGLPVEGELSPAKRRALVSQLGNTAMDEINRVTEVTPGSLSALALLSDEHRAVPHEVLVRRCQLLLTTLQKERARVHPRLLRDGSLRTAAVCEALQLYLDAKLMDAHEPEHDADRQVRVTTAGPRLLYRVHETKRAQLDTAKNPIVHFFVKRAFISVALLMDGLPGEVNAAAQRAEELSDLFAHEFRLPADRLDSGLWPGVLTELVDEGVLRLDGQRVHLGAGRLDFPALSILRTYRAILRTFLEGYVVAARSLRLLLKGPLPERELKRRAAALGERMFLADEIQHRESISASLFANALLAFHDQGYVARRSPEIRLAESLLDEGAVAAIEGRVRRYLVTPPEGTPKGPSYPPPAL